MGPRHQRFQMSAAEHNQALHDDAKGMAQSLLNSGRAVYHERFMITGDDGRRITVIALEEPPKSADNQTQELAASDPDGSNKA